MTTECHHGMNLNALCEEDSRMVAYDLAYKGVFPFQPERAKAKWPEDERALELDRIRNSLFSAAAISICKTREVHDAIGKGLTVAEMITGAIDARSDVTAEQVNLSQRDITRYLKSVGSIGEAVRGTVAEEVAAYMVANPFVDILCTQTIDALDQGCNMHEVIGTSLGLYVLLYEQKAHGLHCAYELVESAFESLDT